MTLALVLGIFTIFPLKERVTNAKQVQMMAGVNPLVFWISNFAWDFVIYMVVATVLVVILYLFDARQNLHVNGGFITLWLLYTLTGLAGIPWSYILSFPVKSASSAFTIITITSLVTGVVAPLATYFLRLFNGASKTNLALISDIVRYIFSWSGPFFPLGRALLGFINTQETNTRCANEIKDYQLQYVCQLFVSNPDSYFTVIPS